MTNDDKTQATVTRKQPKRSGSIAQMARLRVVSPDSAACTMALGNQPMIVGRSSQASENLCIPHSTVSRQHLSIAWDAQAGGHVIADLESHNGTWLNAERLSNERQVLRPDDVLRLGDVIAVYEVLSGPPSSSGADVNLRAVPGESLAAHKLRSTIGLCAQDPSPVLLIGATGTGKELVAREVHRLSERRGEFVALNCAELSPQLIESQLFGHERGAFTGASQASPGLFRTAHGGTLFLDEIGELPLSLQPKLLRVLQEGEVRSVGDSRSRKVDVRVIAATNRNLPALIETEQFRRDLYARLALWEIHLPTLSERRGDIPGWITLFLQRWASARPGQTLAHPEFEPEAMEAILLHPWPDNLRGLDRLVHQLAKHPESLVTYVQMTDWLAPVSGAAPSPHRAGTPTENPQTGRRPTPNRAELEQALETHQGSIRAVAKHFGRDRRQIYRWMERFGIERED